MNSKALLIAIACGLAAALAFVSPLSLGMLGIILSTFTALPLFVAALGFGTVAGAISGAVAFAVVAVFSGPAIAAAVAVATLVPALIIGHLAGLMRADNGVEEWYPLSRIFAVMVFLSAAIATVLLGFSGYSTASAEATFLQALQEFAAALPAESQGRMTQDVMASQAKLLAELVPLALPASALFVFVINLHLAARIARAAGWMLRPADHLPSNVALPVAVAAVFAVAIVLSFFGGGLGLGARVIAGACGMGFLLVGLATIHYLTIGMQARGAILSLLYLSLLAPFLGQILGPFVALAAIVTGLAETFLGLRARRAVPPPQT